jgi:hypothetical protein
MPMASRDPPGTTITAVVPAHVSGSLLFRQIGAGLGIAQRFPGEYEGCPLANPISLYLVDRAELLRYPGLHERTTVTRQGDAAC